jgi:hypothetical protein
LALISVVLFAGQDYEEMEKPMTPLSKFRSQPSLGVAKAAAAFHPASLRWLGFLRWPLTTPSL